MAAPHNNKEIVLVTGANQGLGLEVVYLLAQRNPNAIILLGSRSLERGQQALDQLLERSTNDANAQLGQIVVLQIDVTLDSSVNEAAEFILKNYGKLNILINNSGVVVHKTGKEGAEETIAVNYFGVQRVINALLPLIPTDGTGRIVIVSSEVGSWVHHQCPSEVRQQIEQLDTIQVKDVDRLIGEYIESQVEGNPGASRFPQSRFGAYGVSKMLVSTYGRILARELKSRLIPVVLVCPGFCKTNLNNYSGFRSINLGAKSIVFGTTVPLSATGNFYQDGTAYPMAFPQTDMKEYEKRSKEQMEENKDD